MAASPEAARAARRLDELYREHVGEVYRYTLAVLGNRADAEDVTQTTFMNALRALERGEQPRKPGNWLIAIAHNLVRQRFRHERARPTEVALEVDAPGRVRDAEDADTPSVDELLQALARIPPSQRAALVMREFEGRPYAEIAEILAVTTSALETLLFRARRSLAEELVNLVTCEQAQQDLSRGLDGRLTRKQRRRLEEHVSTCPSCARFRALQHKQRRALKGLTLLPLPLSLTVFRGGQNATAATLPTLGGAAAGGAAVSSGGGLVLGGVVGKAAAVVAAATMAGGVGYEGVREVRAHAHPANVAHTSPPPATNGRSRGAAASAERPDTIAPARGGGWSRTAGASRRGGSTSPALGLRPKANGSKRGLGRGGIAKAKSAPAGAKPRASANAKPAVGTSTGSDHATGGGKAGTAPSGSHKGRRPRGTGAAVTGSGKPGKADLHAAAP